MNPRSMFIFSSSIIDYFVAHPADTLVRKFSIDVDWSPVAEAMGKDPWQADTNCHPLVRRGAGHAECWGIVGGAVNGCRTAHL
jgi:hypothetical protein